MERTPFDGCVFHVDARPGGKPASLTWEGWGRRRFAEDDVKAARDDLRALRPSRFTRNFLRFNVTPGDVDWFDDFAPILSRTPGSPPRSPATAARRGSCSTPSIIKAIPSRTNRSATPRRSHGPTTRRRPVVEAESSWRRSRTDIPTSSSFSRSGRACRDGRCSARGSRWPRSSMACSCRSSTGWSRPRGARRGSSTASSSRTATRRRASSRRATELMTEGVAPIVADPAAYRRVVSAGLRDLARLRLAQDGMGRRRPVEELLHARRLRGERPRGARAIGRVRLDLHRDAPMVVGRRAGR